MYYDSMLFVVTFRVFRQFFDLFFYHVKISKVFIILFVFIYINLRKCINPFHANVPFLCPLKTSENLWFSNVFRGYRYRTLALSHLAMYPLETRVIERDQCHETGSTSEFPYYRGCSY